ncbi:MAG: M48 family metallopeptidase, partial [Nitrosomonadales bacterium]|nr:M48 family metallopeptidase [Nitrosomonadales bacterium]
MKYVKNFNLAFIITILLFGCTSTTKKSDSDVDRIQLMILPEFMAMDMSQNGYTEILDNAKKDGALNVDTILVERIRGVSYNLINQTYIFRDDTQDWNWEINVIESESINAFCMPGGKIVVYSGLVNKLDATDDELAAVIGHEIAHALREHGRERMSS